MKLSDPVSILLQYPQQKTIADIQTKKDPDFFLDMKNHLNTHPEAIKERIEYHKKFPSWSNYRVRDEFARSYSETFLKDIMWFHRSFPSMDSGEAAQAFCSKYRGYQNVYGFDLVRRALERL